jgi:Flp pilus assembly protein TadD
MNNTIFKIRFFRICFSAAFLLVLIVLVSSCSKETTDSNILLKKAVTLASKDGNWQESLGYARKATEANPRNTNALVMYALALEHDNQKDKAKKELRQAVKISPKNFMPQLSLGQFLYEEKDYEGAYEYLANAYKIQPGNIDALILYAQCSAKLQTQNTDKLFLKLTQTEYFKNKPEIYNELGVYYTRTKKLSKAAQNFTQAYKLSPNNPLIVSNLGVFCDRYLKKPKKARFFYRKFISITNNNAFFDNQRKQIITRLKEISKYNTPLH